MQDWVFLTKNYLYPWYEICDHRNALKIFQKNTSDTISWKLWVSSHLDFHSWNFQTIGELYHHSIQWQISIFPLLLLTIHFHSILFPRVYITGLLLSLYAYVITQDICNKFIEVNFFVGCMVSRPNLFQDWTSLDY